MKEHRLGLPAASWATQMTVLVPTGKAKPEGGLLPTVTPGQLSVALRLKWTTAEHCPGSFVTTTDAGHTIAGGWVSATTTLKLHEAILPEVSVAVQTTVLVP